MARLLRVGSITLSPKKIVITAHTGFAICGDPSKV